MDQTHAIRKLFGNSHHTRARDYLSTAFREPCTPVRPYLAFHLQRYSCNDCASAHELQGLGIGDEHHR